MSFDFAKAFSDRGCVTYANYPGASFAQVLGEIHQRTQRPVVVVVSDVKRAAALEDELNFFAPKAKKRVLSPYDVMPYYGLSPHRKILIDYPRALYGLLQRDIDFLIVPELALFKRVVPKAIFQNKITRLVRDDVVDRSELIQDLVSMGYTREPIVEDVGQFSVRGDLIDVFSPQYEDPVRVSLFDIEVESLKFFDASSQRTKTSSDQIDIIPTSEIYLTDCKNTEGSHELVNAAWKSHLKKRTDSEDLEKQKRDQVEDFIRNEIYFHGIEFFLPLFYKNLDSLFDYFAADTIFVTDEECDLELSLKTHLSELEKHREDSDHIETIFAPQEILLSLQELVKSLDAFVQFQPHRGQSEAEQLLDGQAESNLFLKSKLSSQITKVHSLAPLASELNQKRLEGIACFLVCHTEVQRDRLVDLLQRFELPLKISDHFDGVDSRLVHVLVGAVHEGFYSRSLKQWWISEEEIFGKKTKRSVSKKRQTAVFSSFSELSEGDYLIHMDHGIGVYRGLVKLDVDVHQNDFLLIEYLGNDKLYVPIDSLNRVQRFVAEEGTVPHVDKLGGNSWHKVKTKAKKAARKLAGELLSMQAKREALVGHAFELNLDLNEEFSAQFTFEETPDQMAAIEEVQKDMGRERPMDRLVCGDVGYGKTEVAMRAVFRCVSGQRQAVILVPTTVLAFQHYKTFCERFKNYGMRIELLSRFRSAKEQRDVITQLAQGSIDVVVGTHRLLSKDIKFANLGLLVIDEEHRFGVTHKEKIKKFKNLVDVLTLTATPIPRTLNFALNGIRDLSIINTPPVDRLAIKTFACAFDEVTIRDAILKEIKRGGQVYFVHNRVQSIEKVTKQLSTLLPEIRIRYAHGQMEEHDLEDIMIDFMDHKFDVLVCTTIIESGLDIPNANTMLINRADALGLAQLYQLRGRVGRSYHQAYCYLIVPSDVLMTTKAKKRLAVIQRFTELGSGFKIASRDLEIRGAGNILGDQQSGHIAAVGYDLYIHLLKQAVEELKNQSEVEEFEPELKFDIAAKIPDDYIEDNQLRLVLYKQMSSCEGIEEVNELLEEWEDRFGKIPAEVKNLASLIQIKVLCKKLLVLQIRQSGERIALTFHKEHKLDPQIFIQAIQNNPKKFSLTRDGQFLITQRFSSDPEMLGYVSELLEQLSQGLQGDD